MEKKSLASNFQPLLTSRDQKSSKRNATSDESEKTNDFSRLWKPKRDSFVYEKAISNSESKKSLREAPDTF